MKTEEIKQAFSDIADAVGTVNYSSHKQMREGLESALEIAQNASEKLAQAPPAPKPLSSLHEDLDTCKRIAEMLGEILDNVDRATQFPGVKLMTRIHFKGVNDFKVFDDGSFEYSKDSEIPYCFQIVSLLIERGYLVTK